MKIQMHLHSHARDGEEADVQAAQVLRRIRISYQQGGCPGNLAPLVVALGDVALRVAVVGGSRGLLPVVGSLPGSLLPEPSNIGPPKHGRNASNTFRGGNYR